jgi:hypothetical protein
LVQAVDGRASRLRSEDRQGRTRWTVELPVAASPDWNGASFFDVPAPPAAGSQGTAFVVTGGESTVVYAVDPSGKVTGRSGAATLVSVDDLKARAATTDQEHRERLNKRLRGAFVEGAEEDSRRRLGRATPP